MDLADPVFTITGGTKGRCIKDHNKQVHCAHYVAPSSCAFSKSARYPIKMYRDLRKLPPENLLLSSSRLFDPTMPRLHQAWIKVLYNHYWLLLLKQSLQCLFPSQKLSLIEAKMYNHLPASFLAAVSSQLWYNTVSLLTQPKHMYSHYYEVK